MIKSIKKRFPSGSFSHNVLTLMTGTTIAQAIPIAISPILTRIYTPEDFGIFALYMSLVSIFSSFVAGKYESAILLPKSDTLAKQVFLLSFSIIILVSLLLLMGIIIFLEEMVLLIGNENIKYWLLLVPLSVFLMGSINIMYHWLNREQRYKKLANSEIYYSVSQANTNVLVGTITNITGGLILGTLIGMMVRMTYYIFLLKKTFSYKLNIKKLFFVAKKYVDFPKYLILSGLLDNVSTQLPVLLIGNLFGSSIVGFYSLSYRIVRTPIMILSSSVATVFKQQASKDIANYGNCHNIYVATLKKLILIATIPFIAFFFIAPNLFSVVFGEAWRVAGEYAQILTPLFYLQFITSPFSSMFMIAEKQRIDLLMQIGLLISVILVFISGYFIFDSIEITLILLSFVYSIKYIIELFISYKLALGSSNILEKLN